MKLLFLFLVVVIMANAPLSAQKPAIIPMPETYNLSEGNFTFSPTLAVTADQAQLPMLDQFFERAAELGFDLKYKIAAENVKTGSLILKLNPDINTGNAEGYHLTVTPANITIEAATDNGLFYGLQTLLQLIAGDINYAKNHQIPCLTIEDAPAHGWRGIMLDESRHFFGPETVKELLDWMAYYKLNIFHWHLTDTPGWRIEIKQYPKLTTVGATGNLSNPDAPPAFYTQQEIKEIIRYAANRSIEIIPEIDMPGHAAAANRAYPEFSGGGSEKYPEFTFNPGKKETYQYLTNILKEVAELFPSQYIHIGGDEVHFGNHQWKNLPGVQRLMQEHDLANLQEVEHYFINRMADSIQAMGKTMIGWDEIVNAHVPPEQSMVMWWRHDKPEVLQKALSQGYQTALCPRIPLYFDFVQHESHISGRRWAGEFVTLKQTLNFNHTHSQTLKQYPNLIPGLQANLWSETFHNRPRLFFMTFPRIAALSEAVWTGETADYNGFLERLKPSFNLYDKLNIPFFNPMDPDSTPEIKGPVN